MLAKYTYQVAPAGPAISATPVRVTLAVDGSERFFYDVAPDVEQPAIKAPVVYDIFRNDVLFGTVYGDTEQQASQRAARWSAMLTAADVLANGEGSI
jgi:hypothetical protein